MSSPYIEGLKQLSPGDIITLDPAQMKRLKLPELLALMQRLGLSTAGIDSHGKAAKTIVEKGAIEVA